MNPMTPVKTALFIIFALTLSSAMTAQEEPASPQENLHARGTVTGNKEIRLRWAPSNPKVWSEGRKYGYTLERYTVMIDSKWQQNPVKQVFAESIKPRPLKEWEEQSAASDYAAVIAQAFYGENFELSSAGKGTNAGTIINQANELEQRFATSVFMAEYDYRAAELAGWAYTDNTAKENEKYLYRIILNRPVRQQGDTAAVYIGLEDKRELPKPIGLTAVFGDRAAMLSWNYTLLSDTYHSYHIERKSGGEPFKRITELPVTALDGRMTELFYTDSLPDNETMYTYRIAGLTGFDETGLCSDEVAGQGKKAMDCIAHIYSGDFTGKGTAKIYWTFECEDNALIQKFSLAASRETDGNYLTLVDSIAVRERELEFTVPDTLTLPQTYLKLRVQATDGTRTESFPFLLRAVDSIPPAIPTGLKVEIDSVCVAHLSWQANTEKDLRGYRILRSFTPNEEKSSITPEFISRNDYTDTLSVTLGNPNVYYSLTAVDERYNESQPCEPVKAAKPDRAPPDEPVITACRPESSKVTLEWVTNPAYPQTVYTLTRIAFDRPEETKTVFKGDYRVNSYGDEVPAPGRYAYRLVATAANGKKSFSPQLLEVAIASAAAPEGISGFTSYADPGRGYIELSWRRQGNAKLYRIYKAGEDGKFSLWRELDAAVTRLVDEKVSPGVSYRYSILYITNEGRPSKASTITVNY